VAAGQSVLNLHRFDKAHLSQSNVSRGYSQINFLPSVKNPMRWRRLLGGLRSNTTCRKSRSLPRPSMMPRSEPSSRRHESHVARPLLTAWCQQRSRAGPGTPGSGKLGLDQF
jgi:hypothetical protein